MKYRQSQYLSKDANTCVAEILRARGVENIEAYMRPDQGYENDSMLLDNVETAAKRLVEHLERKSSILFIVDADCDGYSSSSILWLYIKDFYPNTTILLINRIPFSFNFIRDKENLIHIIIFNPSIFN